MKIGNFNNFDQLNEGSQGGGNKFILVRFGNTPNLRVTQYFGEVAARNPKPIAMKGPGSIITMFESPKTKEALIQGFDALGISYNLYQIIHTSGGGSSPSLVGRQKSVADLKRELQAAIEAEDFEKATKLRDEIARLEGMPTPASGPTESKTYTFSQFMMVKESEENEAEEGVTNAEFNKLVSQLIDHEIEECEGGEEGEIADICKKIKDYMVQHNLYVAPEEKEEGTKKEGEEE